MNVLKRIVFGPLLMALLAGHAEAAFQQCLQDLCGRNYTVTQRYHGTMTSSRTRNLSELENTDWGRELTQKIDAHYIWKAELVRQKMDAISEVTGEFETSAKEVCLRTFQRNSSLRPERRMIDQFENFISREHRELVHKVRTSPHLSETSRFALASEIEKLFINFPLSRETYQSMFMQFFDSHLNQMQEHILSTVNDLKNDVQPLIFIQQLMSETETDLADFCRETLSVKRSSEEKGEHFTSYIEYGWNANTIKFGPAAVWGARSYARQVFYHEVGHGLKRMLEAEGVDLDVQQLFAPARACLQDRQDKISGRGEFYLSEDFADLITATFEDSSSRPFACEYFWVEAVSGRFYGQDSLLNPNAEGVHSSDLLRALFNSIDRGMGLPASCQTALEDAGHGDFQEWQCSLF